MTTREPSLTDPSAAVPCAICRGAATTDIAPADDLAIAILKAFAAKRGLLPAPHAGLFVALVLSAQLPGAVDARAARRRRWGVWLAWGTALVALLTDAAFRVAHQRPRWRPQVARVGTT